MEFNITTNLQVLKLKVPKCEIFDPFDSFLYHKASLWVGEFWAKI
jgi:hypothetical protein